MAMISLTDLFYGKRESVQILKDEDTEILEIIHRYNYFYTDPSPPLSDAESDLTTEETEEESDDLESNWQDVEESSSESSARESSVQDADDLSKDGYNEEKSRITSATTLQEDVQEAKVLLKVPMCCPECEETVTIALKNVAGVDDVVTFLLKKMVTVTGTASPGNLLLACRDLKLFRKTRLWRDNAD